MIRSTSSIRTLNDRTSGSLTPKRSSAVPSTCSAACTRSATTKPGAVLTAPGRVLRRRGQAAEAEGHSALRHVGLDARRFRKTTGEPLRPRCSSERRWPRRDAATRPASPFSRACARWRRRCRRRTLACWKPAASRCGSGSRQIASSMSYPQLPGAEQDLTAPCGHERT